MTRFLDVLKVMGPALVSFLPGGPIYGSLLLAGIEAAEQLPDASGAEKKALVMQMVALGIQGVKTAKPDAPVDPTEIATLVGTGIDTVVGVVNVLAKRVPPPPPPNPVTPG